MQRCDERDKGTGGVGLVKAVGCRGSRVDVGGVDL